MSDQAGKSGEQKDAESDVEGFRKDLGPFVVAAETTRMPMVFTDARDLAEPIIFANDSFLTLTGCTTEEVLGQSFNFLMARDGSPEAQREIEAAFGGSSDMSMCPLTLYSLEVVSPSIMRWKDVAWRTIAAPPPVALA